MKTPPATCTTPVARDSVRISASELHKREEFTSTTGSIPGENASRGYPRAVNNLAVNALTAAFARDSAIVDEKAARTAISEAGAD